MRADQPVELVLSGARTGRLFSNTNVDLVQEGRVCASGLALLHQPDRDLITHTTTRRASGGPMDAPVMASLTDEGIEVRSVGGVDTMDRADRGPAQVSFWVRMAGVTDLVTSQALVSFFTAVWLIPTALRPHEWAMADTHVEISTGPVSHTMWFHAPFSVDQWLLFELESPQAGRGRTFGQGHIYDESGAVVASCGEENMIRHFPEGQSPTGQGAHDPLTGPGTPLVVGPVVGARPPWSAPPWGLEDEAVVVEEFQLHGTTVAYDAVAGTRLEPDGRWQRRAGGHGGLPRTRLLVVRPRDPAAANGTVLLHWQNVSAGYEHGRASRRDLEDGFTWVGVSAQEVGLYGSPVGMGSRYARSTPALLEHDPERYGDLHHPGDQGSFEIFRQAAWAVGPHRTGGPDPLGGIEVRRVVALGASQSAMRLAALANVFADDVGLDGMLLTVWEGRAPRPSDGVLDMGGMRSSIRDDLRVPVVVVNSEFEANAMTALPEPVADTPRRRVWEVAGAPHTVWTGADPGSGRVGPNPLSLGLVRDAALAHLQAWLVDGTPAPPQPRIVVDADTGRLARDADGNARGGVRLPELVAATHTYRGMWMGSGRPPLFGGAQPLPDEVLRARYPTASAFLACWDGAVDDLVATGALLVRDAPAERARGRGLLPPGLT